MENYRIKIISSDGSLPSDAEVGRNETIPLPDLTALLPEVGRAAREEFTAAQPTDNLIRVQPATLWQTVGAAGGNPEYDIGLLAERIGAAVADALADLKVYVLESEISAAQKSVRTIVEQAQF